MVSDKAVTLGVTYFATTTSAVLIGVRVGYRYRKPRQGPQSVGRGRLLGDDRWAAWALLPLIIRLGVIHAVLEYGTNALPPGTDVNRMGADERERRVLGSRLVFLSRILFPAFLWMMKGSLMIFYSRLVVDRRYYDIALRAMWILLAATYIGVLVSLFVPCYPLEKAWQVLPPPSITCTHFNPYLYTTSALNITTGFCLLILPFPLIFRSIMPLARKIQFTVLFSLGIICIVLSAVRLPIDHASRSMQTSRTLFSSLEVLASCIVANAPALHGIWRDWRTRRFLDLEDARRTGLGGSTAGRSRAGAEDGAMVGSAFLKRGMSYSGIEEEEEEEEEEEQGEEQEEEEGGEEAEEEEEEQKEEEEGWVDEVELDFRAVSLKRLSFVGRS